MIKEDMIDIVAKDTGYGKQLVSNVIDSVLCNITSALSNGEKIKFKGFGTFEPKKRAAKVGRNPHTGEVIKIPARIMPTFIAGKTLKEFVCREDEINA